MPTPVPDPLVWLREQFPEIAGKFWVGCWSGQFSVMVAGYLVWSASAVELAGMIRDVLGVPCAERTGLFLAAAVEA